MDFNSLKQKFSEVTKTATEKAKELSGKALEFAWENLAKTPLFIQTEDEMKKILENKKVVLLAFDEKNEIEKEVMLMLPIWQTQSWIDSSAFRYLNNEKSGTLITENNFSFPFEMRVYFQGLETARFTDIESAKNWWKQEKRNYEKSEEFENKEVSKNAESKASVSEELEDPLKNTK